MLGQLLQPKQPVTYANTVEQLLTYSDGLSLCLRDPAQVQESHGQGMYQLLLADTRGRAARGELVLASNELITWKLEPLDNYMQVAFVGLQPIRGQWHLRVTPEQWCIDVQISSMQAIED